MDLHAEIDGRDGAAVRRTLHVLVKGWAARSGDNESALGDEEGLSTFAGEAIDPALLDPAREEEIARALLHAIADTDQAAALENALTAPKTRDPITLVLVAAGVVFLLQSHIQLEVTSVGGKRKVHFKFEKKPTSESLIGKVLGLVGKGK